MADQQNNVLAKAEARYLRVSPQKARLVIDMIRGQQAGDAINILSAVNKRMAPAVEKVLRSAIANAEKQVGGHGRRPAVCNGSICERRAAAEADPARSDGPCVSLSTSHGTHCGEGRRARGKGREE